MTDWHSEALYKYFCHNTTRYGTRRKNVQNRQLQTWLREDEWEQLEYEWKEQLELRSELKDKLSELKRYEEKPLEASFYYNRAEGYSSKGKHNTAKSFYNKSESLCEDALEILQEILHYDSRLTSNQSVKLAVVERAMHNIGRDAEAVSKPTVSQLDKFLSTDD